MAKRFFRSLLVITAGRVIGDFSALEESPCARPPCNRPPDEDFHEVPSDRAGRHRGGKGLPGAGGLIKATSAAETFRKNRRVIASGAKQSPPATCLLQ